MAQDFSLHKFFKDQYIKEALSRSDSKYITPTTGIKKSTSEYITDKSKSISQAETEAMRNSKFQMYNTDGDQPYITEISQRAKNLVDGYELEDLQRNLEQVYRDMEEEAEPEGGPIADQYADELHAYEEAIRFIKNKGSEKAQRAAGSGPDGEMTYGDMLHKHYPDKYGPKGIAKDKDTFNKSSKFDRLNEGDLEDYRLEPEDLDDPDEDLVIIGSGYLDIKNNFKERPSQTNGEYATLGQKVVDQLHKGDKDAALNFIYSKINEVDKVGLNESTEKSWNAIDVSRKAEKEIDNREWNERTAKKLDMLIALNKAGKFKKDWGEEKLQGWVDKNYSWEKLSQQFKLDEGSCGYTPDGEPRDKPAGPHLLKLKERIFNSFKKQ